MCIFNPEMSARLGKLAPVPVAALESVRIADHGDHSALTAADLTAFGEALNSAFGDINESRLRTMMDDLVDTAVAAVPGIVAEFADWPAAIHLVSNILAHRGTRDAHDQFINTLIAPATHCNGYCAPSCSSKRRSTRATSARLIGGRRRTTTFRPTSTNSWREPLMHADRRALTVGPPLDKGANRPW